MTPLRQRRRARSWQIATALLVIGICAGQIAAQIPASTYAARRTAAIRRLGADLLVVPARGAFAEADQRGFVQAPDFQYLTGLEELVGSVLVLDGATSSTTLFVVPPGPRRSVGTLAPGADTAQSLQFSDVLPIGALESWLRQRFVERQQANVYVASADARGAVEAPPPMARSLVRWEVWLTALGAARVRPGAAILSPLRDVKGDSELAILRRVAIASRDAALAGMRAVAPDRWEHDAELAVVNSCMGTGARGVSFWPWTLSGPNATLPSMRKSFVAYDHLDRRMRTGELVRIDVGCQIDHYMGDVGRTVPVSGRFTSGQREAWDILIAGYRAGLAAIKHEVSVSFVYDAALAEIRRRAASLETPEGRNAAAILLAPAGRNLWSIHGVGLDDAEGAPDVLSAGMVVAYEPMFMVDGDAFYLEDMLAITREGYELLTPGLPYTAREIEAAMSKRR